MPSSCDYLRALFMVGGSDGIGEAEDVIKAKGGRIEAHGQIVVPDECFGPKGMLDKDLSNACLFLIEEWDYGLYNEENWAASLQLRTMDEDQGCV